MLALLTVSKALLRSTKHTNRYFFDLNVLSNNVFNVRMWSLVRHFLLKPICSGHICSFSSIYLSSLLTRTLLKAYRNNLKVLCLCNLKDQFPLLYKLVLSVHAKHLDILLGPVVQSVVSLTNSLRIISFTVLADSLYNIPIFFAKKTWVGFALHKATQIFSAKKKQKKKKQKKTISIVTYHSM